MKRHSRVLKKPLHPGAVEFPRESTNLEGALH